METARLVPVLKLKKKEVLIVDYNDFDRFVKLAYPKLHKYEFVSVAECGNDSYHSFAINIKYEWDKWKDSDEKDWKEFSDKNGLVPYNNHLLFKKLFHDGFLEEGEYLIHVSW